MTKAEKKKVLKAIKLIHDDDNYDEGMTILCNLVGIRTIYEKLSIESVDLVAYLRKIREKSEEK